MQSYVFLRRFEPNAPTLKYLTRNGKYEHGFNLSNKWKSKVYSTCKQRTQMLPPLICAMLVHSGRKHSTIYIIYMKRVVSHYFHSLPLIKCGQFFPKKIKCGQGWSKDWTSLASRIPNRQACKIISKRKISLNMKTSIVQHPLSSSKMNAEKKWLHYYISNAWIAIFNNWVILKL